MCPVPGPGSSGVPILAKARLALATTLACPQGMASRPEAEGGWEHQGYRP